MASNRMMADNKVDTAREKIREWGAGVKQRQPWGEHAWHLLGHALQYAHEAIENDPTYQRPWTLLADIYHRIGRVDLARQCLAKSYALATSGPRFPGNFYRTSAVTRKAAMCGHLKTGHRGVAGTSGFYAFVISLSILISATLQSQF